QRVHTDQAIEAFRRGVHAGPKMLMQSAQHALTSFNAALGRLMTIRSEVDARQISPLKAFEGYNSIIDGQFSVYSKLIVVDNSALYQQATASLMAGRALEMVEREVTLVNGALANHGRMTRGERNLFAAAVANQRLLMSDALRQLSPDIAAGYRSVYTSPAYQRFATMENRIISSIGNGRRIPVSLANWSKTSFSLLSAVQAAHQQGRLILPGKGTKLGAGLLIEVLLAGGLGLIAVALSVILMIRFGRRITRELTGLQRSALDLSERRLPQVVDQLSHGEDVDV